MIPIVLENQSYRLEICNPNDVEDMHLHTRFSHCGYITRIFDKENNKEILGRAVKEFHPFHGEGFPDEFETPLLYDSVAVGEKFVKIGVGLETKLSAGAYSNWDEHPIVERAKTEVVKGESQVTFVQKVECGSVSYEYIKTISLGELNYRISHCLQNTGMEAWNTLWYSHAFLPKKDLGDNVTFLKNAGGTLRKQSLNLCENEAEVEINIKDMTSEGECFQWDIESEDNFQILLDERKRRILDAVGNYHYQELQVYVNDRIISVEPKLIIRLEAGEQKCWETIYRI